MIQKFFIKLFIVIVISLAIVFIIYPYTKNLSTARNTQRKADLLNLSQVLDRYYTDNPGKLFITLPVDPVEICKSDAINCSGKVDLSFLVSDGLLPKIPQDPGGSLSENGTGYFIHVTVDKRISLRAPTTDLGEEIGISTHRFDQ